jgi:Ser/Thr protein kinase RdoA (MazF antagonist)
MTLRDIFAAFGVEAERIRLLKRGLNSHWLGVSGQKRFVLRRYGADRSMDSVAWELSLTRRLAAAGLPVNAPLARARTFDGALYALFPFLPGRGLRFPHDREYRVLGRTLAEFHEMAGAIGDLGQRPDWRGYVESALPPGGLAERSELLARLRSADPGFADQVAEISDLAAERLPRLAHLPHHPIHGDFSPWNLRFVRGQLTGIFDFDLCHLDIPAADVAFARRGYHDAVVEGYLERRTLSDAEIDALHVLWLAAGLDYVWRSLAKGGLAQAGLEFTRAQFAKTRPYAGRR